MIRRRLVAVLAVGLLVPIATSTPSAGAVEQDLVVSATSGSARDVIAVSSASCVDEPDGSIFRFLAARLVAGEPGSEVMAAAGSSDRGEAVRLVVPDWVDPLDPASIEAICFEFDVSIIDEDGESDGVPVAYDAVPFDVLDPTEPVVQSATFSRTSLLVGQGLQIGIEGCFLEGDLRIAAADVLSGTDLTGETGEYVTFAEGELEGGAATLDLFLTNSATGIGWSQTNDERPVIEDLDELPTTIEAGPHVAFPYCATLDDAGVTYLFFPPAQLDVAGRAPIDDIDLTNQPGTRDVEVAGGSCTEGDVTGLFTGIDIEDEDLFGPFLRVGEERSLRSPLRPAPPSTSDLVEVGPRAISGDDDTLTTFAVTPGADGTWSAADAADFDLGAVRAGAACGDPFADGFVYDAQIVGIDVPPPPVPTTTTTTTVTTTTPPPVPAPPANAVQGTPAYAG